MYNMRVGITLLHITTKFTEAANFTQNIRQIRGMFVSIQVDFASHANDTGTQDSDSNDMIQERRGTWNDLVDGSYVSTELDISNCWYI